MKRFPLLPLAALVFAAAYACTDSTAPANAPTLLARNASIVPGDPPPPPVDVGMTISVSSPGSAVFTGVFFSNGKVSDPTFGGTAWLRLNNKQPTPGGTASPNARFKRQDDNKSGMGTLTFVEGGGSVTYTIVSVEEFTLFNNSNCKFNFDTCAFIRFKATSNKDALVHDGRLTAFNVEGCVFVPDSESEFPFDCPSSG